MFERFTGAAREVVVEAQTGARALGHPRIGPEHLLLGALSHPDQPGVDALRRLGVTPERYWSGIREVIGDGGLTAADAGALSTVGIDLDQVRRQIEDTFGAGALDLSDDDRATRRRSRLPWRRSRRPQPPNPTGHIPFTPEAKRTLEKSLREALALKDRHIGVEHLLLGLLDPRTNRATEVLHHLGVEPAIARQEILDDLGKAA